MFSDKNPADLSALPAVKASSREDVARLFVERLGASAREAVEPWLATPEEYARRLHDLVESVVS